LDSGVSKENIAYLVMELLQGHSLSELLSKEETLSVKRCAEILIPVCEVLAEAQKAGLIHRDIKPDNIFLHQTPEGEVVKVVDFGIAKIFDNSGDLAKLTSSNGVVGTVDYVAPERFGKKPYDGQSDIYSLGVMAYQMLSGQTPFYSLNCSYIDILLAHMYDEPPSLKQNNINIPDELEALVMQALSKDPAKRPTAQEFAQKLAIIARFTPKTTSEASTNFLYSNKKVSLKTKTITIKNYNSISQNHTLSIFCKV
jgi:serine/threonine protein kinase